MQTQHHPIDFHLDDVVRDELPYVSAFYRDGDVLRHDLHELFEFPVAHRAHMPFYAISEAGCERLGETFDRAYAMLIDAVRILFERPASLQEYFDCEFLRVHGKYFIPYAIHTFHAKGLVGQPIYGRFDAALDPVKEEVVGIYEFNGDTPVMLFESVNLQNAFTRQITGGSDAQYNDWYRVTSEMLASYAKKGCQMQFAAVCDTNYVEDIVTCETLAQVIGEHAASYFLDLADLDFDHLSPTKPFVVKDSGTHLDAIFVLSPWEEMVDAFPFAFRRWQDWADNVALLEPAWRWFLSHKGMMAFVTHLMETDVTFRATWSDVPVLRTYRTPGRFLAEGQPFVSKPVLGRLSSNIEIHDGTGRVEMVTEGGYGQCERVYQEYCPPRQVEGRNNFIVGMWIASESRDGHCEHVGHAATLCIREFDGAVLDLANERFIPHVVTEG